MIIAIETHNISATIPKTELVYIYRAINDVIIAACISGGIDEHTSKSVATLLELQNSLLPTEQQLFDGLDKL